MAEEVEVSAELVEVHSPLCGLCHQNVDSVLALCSRGNFCSPIQQVVRLGQCVIVIVAHVIKRANGAVVVGDKHKGMPGGFLDVGTQAPLRFRIEIPIGARNLVSGSRNNVPGLGKSHLRELSVRDGDVYLKLSSDGLAQAGGYFR